MQPGKIDFCANLDTYIEFIWTPSKEYYTHIIDSIPQMGNTSKIALNRPSTEKRNSPSIAFFRICLLIYLRYYINDHFPQTLTH